MEKLLIFFFKSDKKLYINKLKKIAISSSPGHSIEL